METATITVKPEDLKKLYNMASDELKANFEETFGKDVFGPQVPEHEQIYLAACAAKGMAPDAIDNVVMPAELAEHHTAFKTFMKLTLITEHINGGWVPDFNNSSEYKWAPWYKMGAGFGFSRSACGSTLSDTYVGSRLRYKTEEESNKYGKALQPYYQQLLTR